MAQAEKSAEDKLRMSAYGAATTALRNTHEAEFQKILQAEYDKRGLGEAPLGRSAQKKAREEKAKANLVARLEKKRQELEDLEATANALGVTI